MQEDTSREQEVERPDAESEQSRREFITKLVTTAGAVAVAGLAAGGPANADAIKIGAGETAVHKGEVSAYKEAVSVGKVNQAKLEAFKFFRDGDGFRVVVSGAQVGQVLQQAGLLRQGVNLDNAKITIEFSA